jgi:hypothetical protein
MTKINTSWSSPKTNILSALNALRSALNAGQNARLIKMRNEDCDFPIREKLKYVESDFKKFKFSIGYLSTRAEIQARTDLSEFEKYLSLNYKSCFGTQEAIETYYKNGWLSKDNFKGVGRSHLVKVSDMVDFLNKNGESDRAKLFDHYNPDKRDIRTFYDFFRFDGNNNQWNVKKFKRKLWVVELLGKDEPKLKVPVAVHVLNFLAYPLKFIPTKSVLRMPEYTNYTFRVGGVTHGYSVEFQIPKKFSF